MNYIRIIKKHPQILGYGMLHYFFSSIGQTFLISACVPYILEDLHLSSLGFSNRYAMATISSALILPIVGGWVDRLKLSTASLIGAFGLITACSVMFYSGTYALLLPGLFLLRFFGQGLMVLIGSTAVAKFFTENRGKGLSLAGIGLAIAETFMPVLFIFAVGLYGWTTAWLFLAGLVLCVFLPSTQILIRKHRKEKEDSTQNQLVEKARDFTRSQVLKDPKFYLILPAFVFLPFFITGIFIHQNLLANSKGWTMEWMAFTFVGYGIAKVATSFLGGALVDRFTAKKVFVFYLLPLAAGLLLLLVGDHHFFALAYMILLGITASLGSLTGVAIWAELYGVKNLGAIKSMTTTFLVISTAIGPILIGYGFEYSIAGTLITSIAAILSIALLSWLVMRRIHL